MLASDTLLQNRYLVVRPIGKGGMGAVYLAKDQRLRSTVALKETFFEDEGLRKAFEREAALLANLRHTALPRVIDHFNEDKGQFLVMEFIPGEDLEEMFKARGGAFLPAEVLTWADQLLDALDYLHTQEPQIVHRDIKPQNLKLTARNQIVLLDFGLAKGSAGEMSQVAGSGSILGYTPTYAPLEQIHGTGTDPRSDLYSLAATLYHLMTGAKPPDALARASAVIGGQSDPLRPANEINPQVSPAVAGVLARAMSLHSEQRHANAAEMRKALSEASLTPVPVISGDAATVVIPPFEIHPASSAATQVQEAGVTVIDAPVDSKPPVEPPLPSVSKQTPKGDDNGRTTPMHVDAASIPPAPRANRLPLIIGSIVLLLVAGVVIAMIASNNSGTTDNSSTTQPAANKASTANAQPAPGQSNVNSQTKQTTPPAGKSESSAAASQSSKPEPTPQQKKPAMQRPTEKSPPTPIRDRIKARRGAY